MLMMNVFIWPSDVGRYNRLTVFSFTCSTRRAMSEMPPYEKRFDGGLAIPIGKIFGEVPELQPVRMATSNVMWDRPQAWIKL